MTKQPKKKPSRLTRELEEMGRALHRLGALSDMPKACSQHDEYAKITMRDLALDKIDRAGPPSPREIVAIRTAARMSQAVFARLLDVSTGTLSKWERGSSSPAARPAACCTSSSARGSTRFSERTDESRLLRPKKATGALH